VDSARGDVEQLLQEDAIDLAVERPLAVPDWVSREVLFTSRFKVVAAKDHPDLADVAPGAPLPLDLFCRLPQALRSIDGSLSGWTDEALATVGRERRVALALPQFQAVALAVAETRLIAALPEQFAERVAGELGLAVFEPPLDLHAPEIGMYWHSRHDGNAAHRWLRDHVRAVSAQFRR
jgi:DNA-binding transcriptional LysR family regulator